MHLVRIKEVTEENEITAVGQYEHLNRSVVSRKIKKGEGRIKASENISSKSS